MTARGALFVAAAGVPCVLLLIFCATGAHEWWLITTQQIVVAPSPKPGMTSIPEVPASSLLPLIFGSAALAAAFGYALLRRSGTALVAAYAAVLLLAGAAVVLR
jgi:hypothetical protein